MRFLALALAFVIGSGTGCNFAVKHPAATAGIVVGAIGLATCSLTTSIDTGIAGEGFTDSPRAKCYAVTALAGAGISAIAALALWLGYEDDVAPGPGGTTGPVQDPTNLEPAPVFVPKAPPKPEPEPPKPEPAPEPAPAPPDPTPVP